MNIEKRKLEQILRDFGLHALLILAGLILLLNPDGAMALVTKLLGWALVIGCAARLISLAAGNQLRWGTDAFVTGAVLCVGVILLAKPLILANLIGRVIGALLLIEGIRNLRIGGFGILTALTLVGGVLLILMPRTLTQTLFAVVGIGLMLIGMLNIWGKLSDYRRLTEPGDPNIIDADL